MAIECQRQSQVGRILTIDDEPTSSSPFYSQCSTTSNLITCFNQGELTVFTVPITSDDTNVLTRSIRIGSQIEQIRVLYESTTRVILSVNTDNAESKVYQLSRKESTAKEWDVNELDVQSKAHAFYSVSSEKNLAGQQILQALSNKQQLNFQLSTIDEQNLSKTRSYTVELPENMGGIEYLAYSTVKHTQLATLRMQDGSLLVIKFTENGGR